MQFVAKTDLEKVKLTGNQKRSFFRTPPSEKAGKVQLEAAGGRTGSQGRRGEANRREEPTRASWRNCCGSINSVITVSFTVIK